MPTSIMLPTSVSSPVSPGKNFIAANRTGESGEIGDSPGFQSVLQREMNEKEEDSEARLAEENKLANNTFRAIDTQAAPAGNLKEHRGQNGEVLEEEGEAENTISQPLYTTNALAGLEVSRLPRMQVETHALARTNIPASASGVTGITDINGPQTSANHPGSASHLTNSASAYMGLENLDALQQALLPGQDASTDIDPPFVPVAAARNSGVFHVRAVTDAASPLPSVDGAQGYSQGVEAENSLLLEHDNGRLSAAAEFDLMNEMEKSGNDKIGRQAAEPSSGDVLGGATLFSPSTSEEIRRTGDFGSITGAGEALAREAPRLEPRIGAVGWDNALGQKILWMISDGSQTVELNLNPPELGPLQVILSVADDQATAMFVSQQPDVRNALEGALPRLKEMMAENGIHLSGATVSSDSPQQQKGFERHDRTDVRYGEAGGTTAVPETGVSRNHIRSGSSLVDTFA
jgi:flagellar hook-length control protein FliK